MHLNTVGQVCDAFKHLLTLSNAVLRGSASTLGPSGVHVQVLPLHADPQRQRLHLHPRGNLTGQVKVGRDALA